MNYSNKYAKTYSGAAPTFNPASVDTTSTANIGGYGYLKIDFAYSARYFRVVFNATSTKSTVSICSIHVKVR